MVRGPLLGAERLRRSKEEEEEEEIKYKISEFFRPN
jgi:hypothetical protein